MYFMGFVFIINNFKLTSITFNLTNRLSLNLIKDSQALVLYTIKLS